MPLSESIPASPLIAQACALTVPPLITSQPFESIPSPSPVLPLQRILSVPPFTVVTETLSSLVTENESHETFMQKTEKNVRCC